MTVSKTAEKTFFMFGVNVDFVTDDVEGPVTLYAECQAEKSVDAIIIFLISLSDRGEVRQVDRIRCERKHKLKPEQVRTRVDTHIN